MLSSVEAVCVDPKRACEVWATVAPMIQTAMRRGGMGDFEDLQTDVLSGDAFLWLAWDGERVCAAAVTQLLNEVQKTCLIAACAGSVMPQWLFLLDEIEKWAKSEGCERVRVCGRRGWSRVLHDYRLSRVVLEKELG